MNHLRANDISTSTYTREGHTHVAVYLTGALVFISVHKQGVWETRRVSQSPLSPSTIDDLTNALGQAVIDTGLVSCDLHQGDTAPAPSATDAALAAIYDQAESAEQAYADHAYLAKHAMPPTPREPETHYEIHDEGQTIEFFHYGAHVATAIQDWPDTANYITKFEDNYIFDRAAVDATRHQLDEATREARQIDAAYRADTPIWDS